MIEFQRCKSKTNLTRDEVIQYLETGDWYIEKKEDGHRALLTWDGTCAKLTSKNGKDITSQFPEIVGKCTGPSFTLDGEIVALDGKISTVNKRANSSRKDTWQIYGDPCEFVAFDLLSIKDTDLRLMGQEDRNYNLVTYINSMYRFVDIGFSIDWYDLWKSEGAEGVVVKNKHAPYISGHSPSWIKAKF